MELHKCKVSKHETTQHTFTSVYYSTVYTCTWLLSVQEVVKLMSSTAHTQRRLEPEKIMSRDSSGALIAFGMRGMLLSVASMLLRQIHRDCCSY